MEILYSITGIILAARVISFPFAAFFPILGTLFFVLVVFIGFWVLLSPMVSVCIFFGLLFFLWAIGSGSTAS